MPTLLKVIGVAVIAAAAFIAYQQTRPAAPIAQQAAIAAAAQIPEGRVVTLDGPQSLKFAPHDGLTWKQSTTVSGVVLVQAVMSADQRDELSIRIASEAAVRTGPTPGTAIMSAYPTTPGSAPPLTSRPAPVFPVPAGTVPPPPPGVIPAAPPAPLAPATFRF